MQLSWVVQQEVPTFSGMGESSKSSKGMLTVSVPSLPIRRFVASISAINS
jgi:hypothetical protein